MDPTKASRAGIEAYSMVLLHCREQLGLENWQDFVDLLKEKTGYSPPRSMFQRYQSTSFASLPNSGIAFALEAMGSFKFPNGDPVTMFALQEVIIGVRAANGDLVVRNGFKTGNGKPSK
ncbi:hypothetical protein [Pseudanabaena sp. FACHB-2040]|uniref:hypothetical protein n=1 Tax=Pseudanabaena sp. FACHB-2040 TaxID=2692859 RepID=UPI001689A9CB|nr:hypothetical protein [Pseudanabaena sp. FACHB-2040]MBD2261402.1 hypothetical protein [Pseudanabaena sp. FACHB-2040]